MEEETVSVFSHLNQFRIHSITSYCDSHFGVFGRCKGCELETARGNGQHFAVGCFSQSVWPHYPSSVRRVDRQFKRPPAYRDPTAFFQLLRL